MKKTILLTIVFIILLGSINLSHAQPALTIPESIFDFGYAPQHSKISHIFWLYSTGTDTLRIKNVRPG